MTGHSPPRPNVSSIILFLARLHTPARPQLGVSPVDSWIHHPRHEHEQHLAIVPMNLTVQITWVPCICDYLALTEREPLGEFGGEHQICHLADAIVYGVVSVDDWGIGRVECDAIGLWC